MTPDSLSGFAFALTALLWLAAMLGDVFGAKRVARWAISLGTLVAIFAVLEGLIGQSPTSVSLTFGDWPWQFHPDAAGLWLLLPALLPAFFATATGRTQHPRGWVAGVALSLLGALGILGVQDGANLLIAWEALSLGGAIMLLAERQTESSGNDNLFMLALLEVGSVALLLAVILLGKQLEFSSYAAQWQGLGTGLGFGVAVLWLIGFGAKLGLLPFYEWYPNAYGQGSGATGAIMSGAILNMAYFALGRALLDWLGTPPWLGSFGIVVLLLGAFTAIFAILYAFQQNDWRRLLAFSSAENAAVAVTALGAALIFRAGGQAELAELAWLVGLLHLMGHSLAKGSLFFAADAVARATGSYHIRQSGVLRRAPFTLGIGVVFAGMSLAALPPTAGFVSEWYLFQSLFHDFTLHGDGPRIALALAGAGMALTAAIALATMVKVLGVGLLSKADARSGDAAQLTLSLGARIALLVTGLAVPALAISLVFWLPQLNYAIWQTFEPPADAASLMVRGWLLVPLSADFAFISPLKLMIVMPLLALIPLALIWLRPRIKVRRAPIWCGGEPVQSHSGATTALAFSNAMRVFYRFVYRPTNAINRRFDADSKPYFLKTLEFDYAQAPFFGPWLFQPAVRLVQALTRRILFLQNGLMNAYLAYIGILLLLIFAFALFWTPK
ncbi:proton-conducting transporter membrane subunit [Halothiobacillus neapolitanus]|uniref:NADH/Ubiquinone/plastoquinone (Complex I) n=1 Tax=Halothiobacillus neapolitanus (strain ATCC 23641 / DSM 15147 / CIP 104769 / NCIMB 8539 / c2) TaxID=555778 RepID=D0L1N8_HALNC|nr:proton-conducting transporter membrane subunit [Halothiobacillus neapolitanus]ACX96611.1 NADH/Ubiquinone/plastoquinone (complex I) [Halothiobacillus neapolitanus c2]TDN65279.1 formate hydrogenlyase subunit 3/multisubunit Na+/H+ antiporter MnhD subunit [Halothiobacillus neapolitanus]